MSEYELTIQTGKNKFIVPGVEDGVVWETEIEGTPGKLTFTIIADSDCKFGEGNPVRFLYDGKGIFYGFVFQKTYDEKGRIQVVCYDQLRYLLNKDTYVFRKLTATKILKKIAKDYGLNLGTVADTKKVIKSLVEDNKTLLDMMRDALNLTLDSKAEMYVLYDSFGKLTLKAASKMQLDTLINHDTAQSFTYECSIDRDTYNRVKLVYENKDKNTREVYMAKSSKAINNWGLLQYYGKLNNPKNGKVAAKNLLKLKNRATRSLSVSGAFGDSRVRAGTSVPVALKLGDINQNGYLLVSRATHKFSQDRHTMDLTLTGGKYITE